jgi:hypothetical protein
MRRLIGAVVVAVSIAFANGASASVTPSANCFDRADYLAHVPASDLPRLPLYVAGDARHCTGAVGPTQRVVALAPVPDGDEGYWWLGAGGEVTAFGGARDLGELEFTPAAALVDMAATPTGQGYWLVAADGGVFAFGDARFFGSLGSLRLREPVVGMAATPTGRGYWLVAADGGVFAFGDARFFGSLGTVALAAPIVAIATTPSGQGYLLAGSDGGVFAFGSARFRGSPSTYQPTRPIVDVAGTLSGDGYWLITSAVP